MLNILTAGALYAAPRVLTHLYTAPLPEEADNRFYHIRLQISEGIHTAENLIGAHNISIAREILVDNAWISYLFICIICPASADLLSRAIYVTLFSCMIWSVRCCLSSMSPLAAQYIAPPSVVIQIARRLEIARLIENIDLQNQQTIALNQRTRDFIRLLEALQLQHSPTSENAPIPFQGEMTPENEDLLLLHYEMSHIIDGNPQELERFLQPEIPPDPRESQDPILNQFQCNFTLVTPQNIVVDPNGVSFYERNYISWWLFKKGTSPVTRERIDFAYLNKRPLLDLFIAHRRDFLRRERENVNTASLSTDANSISPLYLQELRAIFHEVNIETFDQIPTVLIADKVLNKWICPITKKPIRFIMKIAGLENGTDHVYYEKSAIVQLIEERPEELPPRWPNDVPIENASLVPDPESQECIDRRLVEILTEIPNDPHLRFFKDLAENSSL